MKKITANFHKEMELKLPKSKTIEVAVEEEVYEVEVKNILTLEERTDFLSRSFALLTTDMGFELTDQAGGTLMLMEIIYAITDIEAPEELDERITHFGWLLDMGIVKAVEGATKPGMIEEMADFFTLSMEQMEKIGKDRLEKAEKETVRGREIPK